MHRDDTECASRPLSCSFVVGNLSVRALRLCSAQCPRAPVCRYSVVKSSTRRRPLVRGYTRRAGAQLRRLRQAKGLSQEELAHQAEIDRTYVSALERSVYAAGIDVVDRLARVLGVEAADLLKRPTPKAKKGR